MITPTNVMIVDSDVNSNPQYLQLFKNQSHFVLSALCSNFSEALNTFKKNPVPIIVLEVGTNGLSGVDRIEQLRRIDHKAKIICISTQSDLELIKRAFKNGANGYLTKPLHPKRFFNALGSLENDGAAMSGDVAKKVIAMFQKTIFSELSKRENQIVGYLKQGATYKDIAEKLFVTPSTVNFHIQNIYLKLNVNSKSEALEKLRQMEAYHIDWLNMAS